MELSRPPTPSNEPSDIFSLSDQVLANKLQFVEEIGFGNWGSVWLCRPKASSTPQSPRVTSHAQKIAVKLVHRSKTSTTAARVKSLWNEMKIVRTFRNDPHPSIIPFHSFIITPSYALITMDFLPTLVPVEVAEPKAREWFRSLLSGVEFLHKRGVVHNDIKPANILLSQEGVPVLVDFGFAEKYNVSAPTAFHSNLSYGTPEYLSPERARGLPHDTRKSDVWSLGITFFEILIGRTPFEHSDGEQFITKEDLERYWSRTLTSQWVGAWTMSSGMEKMLQRMIVPNADLRCTASQVMRDPYWAPAKEVASPHRRSSSCMPALGISKLSPTATSQQQSASRPVTPPGLSNKVNAVKATSMAAPNNGKVRPPPKPRTTVKVPTKRRVPAGINLSPIMTSPPGTPHTPSGKENAASRLVPRTPLSGTPVRRPLAVVSSRHKENTSTLQHSRQPSAENIREGSKVRVLGDASNRKQEPRKTATRPGVSGSKRQSNPVKQNPRDHVWERVRDWEREKERLREIERMEELEREMDEQISDEEGGEGEPMARGIPAREGVEDRVIWEVPPSMLTASTGVLVDMKAIPKILISPTPPTPAPTPAIPELRITPHTPNRFHGSGLSAIRHSIKKSIDKTVLFCKQSSSLMGSILTSPRGPSMDVDDQPRESWEMEAMVYSSVTHGLPQQPEIVSETNEEQNRLDRLTMWMKDVERVVEDTRQGFASASHTVTPPPALPIAPSRSASQNRTYHSSHQPREMLGAHQIFSDEAGVLSSNPTIYSAVSGDISTSALAMSTTNVATVRSTKTSTRSIPEIHTPSRQHRATVSIHSPEIFRDVAKIGFDLENGSPSKRKEKSKSHGNLYQRHIAPISLLEAELAKPSPRELSPRLSTMMDRNLFLARPLSPSDCSDPPIPSTLPRGTSFDELSSSPFLVEPYPQRPSTALGSIDTPAQRKLENVYDRFLMATSGVKRVGKGYQSNDIGRSSTSTMKTTTTATHQHKATLPSILNENYRPYHSSGEVALSNHGGTATREGKSTITLVRRAFKAFVPSKTASRGLPRMVA